MKEIVFSIIIPHYNSLDSLPRLLNSIPIREDIEVIVVDNSIQKISVSDVNCARPFKLLYSPNSKFAGGARNVGIEAAQGKWLIFADADDFFIPNAFEIFSLYVDTSDDLVYFKVKGVYDDTLLPSNRAEMYCKIIDDFNFGIRNEISTRLSYVVPWGKMIRRELVIFNNIRFDEVVAANDVMFSTKVALNANKFSVNDGFVYVVTTRAGSLVNRRDLEVVKSRYLVNIRRNIYLRDRGLVDMQGSIMYYLYSALKFGIKPFINFCGLAIKYKQNPFIGYRNWFRTFVKKKKENKINKKYITH